MAEEHAHIHQPVPRRHFSAHANAADSPSHAFGPATPPSVDESQGRPPDFLAQLNARLLSAYQVKNSTSNEPARGEGSEPPSWRNRSFMNLTKSTLFGIYDEEGSTAGDQSAAGTPWGAGLETPARKDSGLEYSYDGLGSPDGGLAVKERARADREKEHKRRPTASRRATRRRRSAAWQFVVVGCKLVALFFFGVIYGIIVSRLHDTHELAAVRMQGPDRKSWLYLASWGLAGVALGGTLPFVDLAWDGSPQDLQGEAAPPYKENERSLGEQLNDIVRSVGAFMGIAFAIRRLPWQSTLQLTLTLALVNPALWYILDRSKPGLSFSLIVTSVLTSWIFLANPDVLPSPSILATTNITHPPHEIHVPGKQEKFAGVVSYDNLAVVTWVGSVLFCSCICFGSIGRRLAVWDQKS